MATIRLRVAEHGGHAATPPRVTATTRLARALTRLGGALAANALAEEATATLNVRVAPGSSVAGAVDHVRRAVRDPRVRVEVVSDHVYRFMPFDMSAQERECLHARDERIRVSTYAGAIDFSTDLLTRLQEPGARPRRRQRRRRRR